MTLKILSKKLDIKEYEKWHKKDTSSWAYYTLNYTIKLAASKGYIFF
jgi:hypothetical protein